MPQSVRATHPRMTLYGADIERTFGSVVLRAEAAYQSDGAWFSLDWARDPTRLLETPKGTEEEETEQRHHFEIGYKPLPWAEVSLGAITFDGGADAYYFGQYEDRDFVYTKLKLIF